MIFVVNKLIVIGIILRATTATQIYIPDYVWTKIYLSFYRGGIKKYNKVLILYT